MSKRFATINAVVMGFAVFLLLVTLEVTKDIAVPILAGIAIGAWWWFSTDLAIKHEIEMEDLEAAKVYDEAVALVEESSVFPNITWDALAAEVEDEAEALGQMDELDEAREQATKQMETWEGGIKPIRQLEDDRSNSDLALRADRAYTIDQLLRQSGYVATREKTDFWSDNYERRRGERRRSIQAIHNLDGSVLTLTEWLDDVNSETSIVSIEDPIDEESLKETLGVFVDSR